MYIHGAIENSVSPVSVPAASTQTWRQREPSGGRPCYQRRSQEQPKMLHPRAFMNPTSTLSFNCPKTRPQRTPRAPVTSPAGPSRSPTAPPTASATTPTTTPCWSPSLTSRRVVGPWRCRARVDSRRSEGFVQAFPYKTKMLRTCRVGKRRYGDARKSRRGFKDFCNNGLKSNQQGSEYMKILRCLWAYH